MPRNSTMNTDAIPIADRLAAAEGIRQIELFVEQNEDEHARALAERLIDRDELAWLHGEELAAEPIESVLYALVDGYALTTPRTKEAETFIAWIQKLANDADTPVIARRECLKFLAAPNAWPSVTYWREHGTYDGMA